MRPPLAPTIFGSYPRFRPKAPNIRCLHTIKGSRPLRKEEVVDILASFGGKYRNRDRALFLMGVTCGFRISEILSITVADLVQRSHMVSTVTVHRRNMKQKLEGRTVTLNPLAQKALEVWFEDLPHLLEVNELPGDLPVFLSRRSCVRTGRRRPISRQQAWYILNTTYAENELTGKLGTHAMRKTFANEVYELLRRDLLRTQKALGHRNLNSTASYLSFREQEITDAILSIDFTISTENDPRAAA